MKTKAKYLAIVIVVLLATTVVITALTRKAPEQPPTDTSQTDALPSDTAQADTLLPTEELTHPVDASWFDDAVFVGDSITLKLSYYCAEHPEALGQAEFFCAGSLGYASALWDIDDPNAVHPYYQGQTELAEFCAEKTDSSKVFIMLGMNDLGMYGVEKTLENADELINRIRSRSPDVSIYVQSTTPILLGKEWETLTNEVIREFDTQLEAYCNEKGCRYLDIYSIMCDADGYLDPEYCGDAGAMGIHFTDAACAMWADYLKNHV